MFIDAPLFKTDVFKVRYYENNRVMSELPYKVKDGDIFTRQGFYNAIINN